ncbi:MAG: DUF4838 domain-containing protein [Phycisphaeraceae bacterium]
MMQSIFHIEVVLLRALLASALVLALAAGATSAAEVYDDAEPGQGTLRLVSNGKPNAIVVIADNPRRSAHVAARELVHYVEKISGAELRIVSDAVVPPRSWSPRRILVGESKLTRAYGLRNEDFRSQEMLIQSRGRDLILMGRDADDYGIITYERNGLWPIPHRGNAWEDVLFKDLGTFYTVHEFLQRFAGVRWYLPGEIGEVAPQRDRLEVRDTNIRRTPGAKYRWSSRLWQPVPSDFYTGQDPAGYDPQRVGWRDMVMHLIRMKVGGERFAANHSFGSYHARFGETHPDWWGEREPRRRAHLDYLHPEVLDQVVQDARDYFDGTIAEKLPASVDRRSIPAAGEYFGVVPYDSSSDWVRTNQAEQLIRERRPYDPDVPASGFFAGWMSDYWFTVVNRVAARVRRTHPDKWISTLAYGRYTRPPEFDLESNIAVQLAGQLTNSFHPADRAYFRENLELWRQRVEKLYIWEYYQRFQGFSNYRNFPSIYPRRVAEGIGWMHEHDVDGMFFEDSGSPGLLANPMEQMLNRYVTWQLLDDPSRDVDELLAEHFELFYGPAAEPMRRYFDTIEQRWTEAGRWEQSMSSMQRFWEVLGPREVIEALRGHLAEALEMDLDEPYRTRVRLVQQAIHARMAATAAAYRQRSAARPRIGAPLADGAPRIDGQRDEVWDQARRSSAFVDRHGQQADGRTHLWIMRDEAHLYVLVEASQADDTEVELMIDPDRTRRRYWRLSIDADGQATGQRFDKDAQPREQSWQVEAQVATASADGTWRMEAALPWTALEAGEAQLAEGRTWGLNVARRTGEGSQYWSPAFGDSGEPNTFGVMLIEEDTSLAAVEPVLRYTFEAVEDGRVADESAHHESPARLRVANDREPWNEPLIEDGAEGNALRLEGESARQYLDVAVDEAIDFGRDDFTLSFWLRTSRPEGVVIGNTTTAPFVRVWFNDYGRERAFPCFYMNCGEEHGRQLVLFDEAAEAASDGRWHHWMLAVDRGRSVRFYLDGRRIKAQAIDEVYGVLPRTLSIGGPHQYLEADLDNFELFRGTDDAALLERLHVRGIEE